ncbi:hypothetical protein ACVGWC_11040, partial [Enterobacter hormaechei]
YTLLTPSARDGSPASPAHKTPVFLCKLADHGRPRRVWAYLAKVPSKKLCKRARNFAPKTRTF